MINPAATAVAGDRNDIGAHVGYTAERA